MIGSRGQQCSSVPRREAPPSWKFHMGSKGQQWSVLKLLQGAVIAVTMLVIIWGVVDTVWSNTPDADTYTVSCEILSSAYAAAGTGHSFTRQGLLKDQTFESDALVKCAGLPTGRMDVKMYCENSYCLYNGRPVTDTHSCSRPPNGCSELEFISGENIDICAKCSDYRHCDIWYGNKNCEPR